MGEGGANGIDGRDGGQQLHSIVHLLGDVYGDVATIAFGPSFLPQIARHFSDAFHHLLQSRSLVQNAFHNRKYCMVVQ